MFYRRLLLIPLLALLGSAAVGQEPPAPASDEVSLIYRYKIGQVTRTRSTTKADANISLVGGTAGGSDIPLVIKIVTSETETTTGTRQGTATLRKDVGSVTYSIDQAGVPVVARFVNGRIVSASANGLALPPDQRTKLAEQLTANRKFESRTLRRSAVGRTTDTAGVPDEDSFATLFIAPDKPVKIGETWEHTERIKPSAWGIPASAAIAGLETRVQHTLKSVEERDGRKLAVVDTSGSLTGDSATTGGVQQSFTGTTRFDIAAGRPVSGQYWIDVTQELPASALRLPPGAAEFARVVAVVEVKMEITPVATKPTPAPKKKKR